MGCPSAGWLRLGGNTKQRIGREIFLRAVQLRVVALNSPRKVRCHPVLCRICQSLILDCIFGFAIFGERILSAAFQRLAIHEASVDASVPNANKLLWPRLFSLADQVVVPSSATRDVMLSLRIPGQRITLTPYCVDNDWWIPESDKVDRTSGASCLEGRTLHFCYFGLRKASALEKTYGSSVRVRHGQFSK